MKRMCLVVAFGLAVTAGCGDGVAFRVDERLRFVAPAERSAVDPPLAIVWTFRGEPPSRYGVFVDRSPMRPREDLADLAEDDPLCDERRGCPDNEWLLRHRVHVTTRPSVVVRALPTEEGRLVGGRRLHDITVVLLDADGTRIGEGAWTLRVFGLEEQ